MLRRPRRNRKTEVIRSAVRENAVQVENLIMPLFLVGGSNVNEVVKSLPIASRMSEDNCLKEIESGLKFGLNKFIMFPAIPEALKDSVASHSYHPDNFYLKVAANIKRNFGNDVCLISDVAMDPYSSDGHDGYVENGEIINDVTLPILAEMALAQAQAGFDILGPSDMMDGRIGAIRTKLDEADYYNTSIMSYTAKYASCFYGPFRDALDSAPKSGDKKTYQMDPANKKEALIEAELDEMEGADFMMVKPALHYLDIIHILKESTNLPISAYHVSGECALLIAAAQNGWIDYHKAIDETLLSIKRAGADLIITYFAKEWAERRMI
ncbi:MAG: porphobilinogen synthase [Saprospiraceae bacterium]|nr:porphobilinogen synthase [Saprospiraceae bacterium]MBK8632450.1 porphobilinogen synthase [Saprospiraceae bacterium]